MKRTVASGRSGLAVLSILVVSLFCVSTALMGLTHSESPPVHLGNPRFFVARQYLDEGKIVEAKRIFGEELKRDPKSIEALRGLALCARDEGDDETALQFLQKLTALAPRDRMAWRQLALTASRLGRDMEALSAAQTALAISPDGDRAMSELMARLLTTRDAFKDAMFEDPLDGLGPTGRVRKPTSLDTGSRIPRPQMPKPSQDLPKPGRGE